MMMSHVLWITFHFIIQNTIYRIAKTEWIIIWHKVWYMYSSESDWHKYHQTTQYEDNTSLTKMLTLSVFIIAGNWISRILSTHSSPLSFLITSTVRLSLTSWIHITKWSNSCVKTGSLWTSYCFVLNFEMVIKQCPSLLNSWMLSSTHHTFSNFLQSRGKWLIIKGIVDLT